MKPRITILSLTASLLLLAACGTNNTAQQTTPGNTPAAKEATTTSTPVAQTSSLTKVNVTASEMKFKLSSATVPAGPVEFIVNNQGKVPHEMVILKIDKPVDKLPLKGNKLDEAKAGKKIGEIGESQLKSGKTETLKVNLTPGKYLLVCNLPGHYTAGMKAELTVK
jgi:uncharacterized cupredoxin-like copper-binding protein